MNVVNVLEKIEENILNNNKEKELQLLTNDNYQR